MFISDWAWCFFESVNFSHAKRDDQRSQGLKKKYLKSPEQAIWIAESVVEYLATTSSDNWLNLDTRATLNRSGWYVVTKILEERYLANLGSALFYQLRNRLAQWFVGPSASNHPYTRQLFIILIQKFCILRDIESPFRLENLRDIDVSLFEGDLSISSGMQQFLPNAQVQMAILDEFYQSGFVESESVGGESGSSSTVFNKVMKLSKKRVNNSFYADDYIFPTPVSMSNAPDKIVRKRGPVLLKDTVSVVAQDWVNTQQLEVPASLADQPENIGDGGSSSDLDVLDINAGSPINVSLLSSNIAYREIAIQREKNFDDYLASIATTKEDKIIETLAEKIPLVISTDSTSEIKVTKDNPTTTSNPSKRSINLDPAKNPVLDLLKTNWLTTYKIPRVGPVVDSNKTNQLSITVPKINIVDSKKVSKKNSPTKSVSQLPNKPLLPKLKQTKSTRKIPNPLARGSTSKAFEFSFAQPTVSLKGLGKRLAQTSTCGDTFAKVLHTSAEEIATPVDINTFGAGPIEPLLKPLSVPDLDTVLPNAIQLAGILDSATNVVADSQFSPHSFHSNDFDSDLVGNDLLDILDNVQRSVAPINCSEGSIEPVLASSDSVAFLDASFLPTTTQLAGINDGNDLPKLINSVSHKSKAASQQQIERQCFGQVLSFSSSDGHRSKTSSSSSVSSSSSSDCAFEKLAKSSPLEVVAEKLQSTKDGIPISHRQNLFAPKLKSAQALYNKFKKSKDAEEKTFSDLAIVKKQSEELESQLESALAEMSESSNNIVLGNKLTELYSEVGSAWQGSKEEYMEMAFSLIKVMNNDLIKRGGLMEVNEFALKYGFDGNGKIVFDNLDEDKTSRTL